MAVRSIFSCSIPFILSLLAGIAFSLPAETTATATSAAETSSTATASASYNVFSAIASSSSSNGATGSTDDPTTAQDANAAGASGSDNGSLNLSTTAIAIIAAVAGAAVIIGVTSAILFYLAKKRQWEVRETMRRSARKVAAALTPRRDTFPKDEVPFKSSKVSKVSRKPSGRQKRGMVRIDPPPSASFIAPTRYSQSSMRPASQNGSRGSNGSSNLEKGYGSHTTIEAVPHGREYTMETPPKSTFDMDSPVEDRKGWSKMFGQRR